MNLLHNHYLKVKTIFLKEQTEPEVQSNNELEKIENQTAEPELEVAENETAEIQIDEDEIEINEKRTAEADESEEQQTAEPEEQKTVEPVAEVKEGAAEVEVDLENAEVMEAATKIQAGFKGYLIRKEMELKRV